LSKLLFIAYFFKVKMRILKTYEKNNLNVERTDLKLFINSTYTTGVYIKFEIHIFLIYTFSQNEIWYEGYIYSLFLPFWKFKSIGEKICILFIIWGKKYAFSPLFSILFQSFSIIPQHVIWPYFCPPPLGEVKQKNIHPW